MGDDCNQPSAPDRAEEKKVDVPQNEAPVQESTDTTEAPTETTEVHTDAADVSVETPASE